MKTRTILCGAFVGMLAVAAQAAESAGAKESVASQPVAVGQTSSSQAQAQVLNNPRLTQLLKEASLSPGVVQVARMADIEMEESVMQAYVQHCETRFNLQPEDLFYLHEHDVPGAVITAMIERGAELRAQDPPQPTAAQSSPVSQSVTVYSQPAPVYQPVMVSPVSYVPARTECMPSGASTVTVIGSSYPHGIFRSAHYYYPYPRVHSRLYGGTYVAFGGRSYYSPSRYYGRSYSYSSHRSYRCYR